jgi:tryptophanyl-tRNA synthetase
MENKTIPVYKKQGNKGEYLTIAPKKDLKENESIVVKKIFVEGKPFESKQYGTTSYLISVLYNDQEVSFFLPEKQLRKQIMSIVSDSTPLEEPKKTETCHTFALYKLLASPAQIEQMKANYQGGNYGYGHAKQALFELILDRFAKERDIFNHLMENPSEIEAALSVGAQKARSVAQEVLKRARSKLGY